MKLGRFHILAASAITLHICVKYSKATSNILVA